MGQTHTKHNKFSITEKNLHHEKDDFANAQKIHYLSVNGMKKYMSGGHKPFVVAATASWCSHCQNLQPVFQQLNDLEKKYGVALFNAYKHRKNEDMGNLGEREIGIKIDDAIKGYPTIFLFDGKGTAALYEGNRTSAEIDTAMKMFLNEKK